MIRETAVLLVAALVSCGGPTGARPAPAPAAKPAPAPAAHTGRLSIHYAEGNAPPIRTLLQRQQVFEQLVEVLNQNVKLPRDIPIRFQPCGQINAAWDAEHVEIVMCDELLDFFTQMFAQKLQGDELTREVLGAVVFTFLHELGHALINQLELPAVGREEDAVDQLAAIILITDAEDGATVARSGAESFLALAAMRGDAPMAYWDEHSFDAQRFYNILCLIYGSRPDRYADMVAAGQLPPARAGRCPNEFAQTSKAWERLLLPYAR